MKHLLVQSATVWLVLASAAGCSDSNVGSSEGPASSPVAVSANAVTANDAAAKPVAKAAAAATTAAKVTAAVPTVVPTVVPTAAPSDADAAQALFKRNSCNKCHSVDKTKTGPSLQKIAAKYRGKADGQEKVITNITTAPKIKLDDGSEEEHKVIDTKDQKELRNLSDWILSQ
jgi:cytochrome c